MSIESKKALRAVLSAALVADYPELCGRMYNGRLLEKEPLPAIVYLGYSEKSAQGRYKSSVPSVAHFLVTIIANSAIECEKINDALSAIDRKYGDFGGTFVDEIFIHDVSDLEPTDLVPAAKEIDIEIHYAKKPR